jgi:cell division protein FtsI (penicillin-binding protein 3)
MQTSFWRQRRLARAAECVSGAHVVTAGTPRNSNNRRLYLLGAILVVWAGAIVARLIYLEIFQYGEFEQRAQRQQQRTTDVAAKRGMIYDRDGRELAMSMAVESVFAVPSEIHDLAGTLSLIAHITREDPRELLAHCEGHTFCWVERKADSDISSRIRALNLRGIHFQKESKRFYPKGDLAAQVIGYVGTDDQGLSGIEREFNDQLRGAPGRMMISVDARKKWFSSVEKEPEPGENVVLTIDQQIQYIAERELDAAIAEWHADSGTVIVENPHTGEILALANRPTFDPNDSREITPKKLKDHAVSDAYEPGSTFKLVTISAALDQKLTRPGEIIDCQMGSIVINGRRIHDWHPYGDMSVADILAHSSDVGAIKIALRLGDDRLYKYIRAYGFGQQTGIELPAETRGMTKPVDRWSKVSIGAIAMGQEIGVSPIQLAAMVSTIANDGVWVAPRIVAGTTEPRKAPLMIAFHPAEQRRVIAPLTAAEMKQMMEGVILRGTGRKAILEGYSAAGKTGTAQKIDPKTGTYSHTKFIMSFAGFAPVNNPAVTVVVILDSPVTQHEAGWVAAPLFQRVAQQVLEYLHTPHDIELPPSRQVLLAERKVTEQDVEEGSPDRLGDNLDTMADGTPDSTPPTDAGPPLKPSPAASEIVEPAAMRESEPAPMQKPAAEAQTPAAEESLPTSGTVVLDVEQGGIVVPSFAGKSVRAAIELAEQSGLELDAVGSGLGLDQSPAAGAHVASGATITVKFGR